MRKQFKVFIVLFVIFSLLTVIIPTVNGSTYYFKFSTYKKEFVDTFNIRFSLPHTPVIKKGVYFVPLRAVVEDGGGNVGYIAKTKKVLLKYGKNSAYFYIGSSNVVLNGKQYLFSLQPFIINGRTLVPVSFIAHLFNGTYHTNGNECVITFYRIFKSKDVLNNELYINTEPKRIISLAPNLTEILFAIGASNKVVGVSSYSNYPPEAESKPKVGGFFSPSIEKIFALNPDIVLIARGTPLSVINKLQSLGIPTYTSDPRSISDIYNLIITIGKITGNVLKSVKLVSRMKADEQKIIDAVNRIPKKERKKVYIEIWNNPKMSVGKGTFIDALIREAGGINIAESAKGDWPIMSDESIIQANPDVIILLYHGNVNEIKNRPGWSTINAVRNGEIFVEDPDIFERPGPRIITALKIIFNILYGRLSE